MPDAVMESQNTMIRALAAQDEQIFCRLFSDATIMQFIGPPMSPERAARNFAAALRAPNRKPVRQLFFAICENVSGKAVGICSVQRIDSQRGCAEIGLMLSPGAQRKGIGKEVVSILTSTVLATLPVTEVWAQYTAQNRAAASLFKGAGFRPRHRPDPELTDNADQICSLFSPD